MSKLLFDLGLLTDVDRAALAAYCVAWGRFVQAEKELQEPGAKLVSETDSGYQQPSAWLQISERAVKQMRAFMTEFGMTPSSRSRVTVDKPKDGDPFMDFLQGE